MQHDQKRLIRSKTKWLPRALLAGFAMLALAAGCSPDPLPSDTEPASNAGAPFPPAGTDAATAGVLASSSFRMSFSLGGAVPSMASDSYQINSFASDQK